MFTRDELEVIMFALESESDWLRAAARHGITTLDKQAMIAALKAKTSARISELDVVSSVARKPKKV